MCDARRPANPCARSRNYIDMLIHTRLFVKRNANRAERSSTGTGMEKWGK
jgi:hypothetical protein